MKFIALALLILLFVPHLPIQNENLNIVGHLLVGFVFSAVLLKKTNVQLLMVIFILIEIIQPFFGREFEYKDIVVSFIGLLLYTIFDKFFFIIRQKKVDF